MGDKDNKTFADLFSGASKDDHALEKETVQKEGITFDQMFDHSNLKNEIETKEVDKSSVFSSDFSFQDRSLNNENLSSDKKEGGIFENNSVSKPISEKESQSIFFNKKEDDSDLHEQQSILNDNEDSSKSVADYDQVNNIFFQNSHDEAENIISKEDQKVADVLSQKEDQKIVDVLSQKEEDKNDAQDFSSVNPFLPLNDSENKEENLTVDSETPKVDLGNIFFKQNRSDEVHTPKIESESFETKSLDKSDSVSSFLEKSKNLNVLEDSEKKHSEEISPFFMEDEASREEKIVPSNIRIMEKNTGSKKIQKLDLSKSKHYDIKVVKKKEPLFKFILGVISYAIFIWLLLIGVTLLLYVLDIKIRASKGDYSTPTFNAYVVLTGSMLPEIQVNDVVVTKKVEASTLKVGDVITFASADTRFLNTIITHRIIKKEYDTKTKTYSFQTQGDNNNVADSALVPQNNIRGKVILKIPKLGYLQEFLASDGGWIIVILIPCLTVISYDIVRLVKGLKRKKYKNITVQK